MSKILVIEDELKIQNIIKDFFEQEGFQITIASDGYEGWMTFEDGNFDLVILDVMMPEMDGWSVCKRIRKISDVPIIMLTARGEEDDKLMGFELRADDYVTKPFSPKVLVARAKMLLSRTHGTVLGSDNILDAGPIQLHKGYRRVTIDDNEIKLQPKEYEILLLFMENIDHVFSRDQLLSKIWDYEYGGDTRVVDTQIKKLRKSLGDRSHYIRTIFGVGYKFEVRD